eukprot:scaffold85051_cov32-Attheya_sp.AAC.1
MLEIQSGTGSEGTPSVNSVTDSSPSCCAAVITDKVAGGTAPATNGSDTTKVEAAAVRCAAQDEQDNDTATPRRAPLANTAANILLLYQRTVMAPIANVSCSLIGRKKDSKVSTLKIQD